MQIREIKDTNSFKGYSARPLKSLVIRNTPTFDLLNVTKELAQIGKKHNFEVVIEDKFVRSASRDNKERLFDMCCSEDLSPWIQDRLFFAKGKLGYTSQPPQQSLQDYLQVEAEEYPRIISEHFAGGNTFLLGEKTALVGNDIDYRDAINALDVDEVVSIPQADFHIDLCVRPLKGRNILVADDDMTLGILRKAQSKLKLVKCNNKRGVVAALENRIKAMEHARKYSMYSDINEVIDTLEGNDFNVIRVPGRIYRPHDHYYRDTCCILNYMNAIVQEDKKGDLVLITNKSKMLEKLGLSPNLAKFLGLDFESLFRSKIKDYVKPENVYFVQGGKIKDSNLPYILEEYRGGIHCLTLEIPE